MKGLSLSVLIDSFPCFYINVYSRQPEDGKRSLENKMDNPTFVDEEDIPMVHRDEEDYDDYKTLDTNRVDETSFIEPDTAEATSTLRLKQKVKQDKINALYRHRDVMGNPDLINLDQFRITKDPKKGSQFSSFTMVIDVFL